MHTKLISLRIDTELLDHLTVRASQEHRTLSNMINAILTDATPIIRCKDCSYGEVDDPDIPDQYLCHHNGGDWNNGEHYCGYAKKR